MSRLTVVNVHERVPDICTALVPDAWDCGRAVYCAESEDFAGLARNILHAHRVNGCAYVVLPVQWITPTVFRWRSVYYNIDVFHYDFVDIMSDDAHDIAFIYLRVDDTEPERATMFEAWRQALSRKAPVGVRVDMTIL